MHIILLHFIYCISAFRSRYIRSFCPVMAIAQPFTIRWRFETQNKNKKDDNKKHVLRRVASPENRIFISTPSQTVAHYFNLTACCCPPPPRPAFQRQKRSHHKIKFASKVNIYENKWPKKQRGKKRDD